MKRINKSIVWLIAGLFFAGPAQAWQIRTSVGDSNGVTVDSLMRQSTPATPVSSSILSSSLPDAFAQVDLPAGKLRAMANDPIGSRFLLI